MEHEAPDRIFEDPEEDVPAPAGDTSADMSIADISTADISAAEIMTADMRTVVTAVDTTADNTGEVMEMEQGVKTEKETMEQNEEMVNKDEVEPVAEEVTKKKYEVSTSLKAVTEVPAIPATVGETSGTPVLVITSVTMDIIPPSLDITPPTLEDSDDDVDDEDDAKMSELPSELAESSSPALVEPAAQLETEKAQPELRMHPEPKMQPEHETQPEPEVTLEVIPVSDEMEAPVRVVDAAEEKASKKPFTAADRAADSTATVTAIEATVVTSETVSAQPVSVVEAMVTEQTTSEGTKTIELSINGNLLNAEVVTPAAADVDQGVFAEIIEEEIVNGPQAVKEKPASSTADDVVTSMDPAQPQRKRIQAKEDAAKKQDETMLLSTKKIIDSTDDVLRSAQALLKSTNQYGSNREKRQKKKKQKVEAQKEKEVDPDYDPEDDFDDKQFLTPKDLEGAAFASRLPADRLTKQEAISFSDIFNDKERHSHFLYIRNRLKEHTGSLNAFIQKWRDIRSKHEEEQEMMKKNTKTHSSAPVQL